MTFDDDVRIKDALAGLKEGTVGIAIDWSHNPYEIGIFVPLPGERVLYKLTNISGLELHLVINPGEEISGTMKLLRRGEGGLLDDVPVDVVVVERPPGWPVREGDYPPNALTVQEVG